MSAHRRPRPGGHTAATEKYCPILESLLDQISDLRNFALYQYLRSVRDIRALLLVWHTPLFCGYTYCTQYALGYCYGMYELSFARVLRSRRTAARLRCQRRSSVSGRDRVPPRNFPTLFVCDDRCGRVLIECGLTLLVLFFLCTCRCCWFEYVDHSTRQVHLQLLWQGHHKAPGDWYLEVLCLQQDFGWRRLHPQVSWNVLMASAVCSKRGVCQRFRFRL